MSGTGADKGTAISEIMTHEGISEETHLPIFIYDYLTDEHRFKIVKKVGIGVLVGYVPKLTDAEYYLRDQEEVSKLLEKLVDAARGNA